MHRCRFIAMCLPLLFAPALLVAGMAEREGPQDSADAAVPRVRVEYAPAVTDTKAMPVEAIRPIRKSVLANGAEITHLEGRGMDRLRILADGDGGRRLVCATVADLALAGRSRSAAPADFRSRPAAVRRALTDAH